MTESAATLPFTDEDRALLERHGIPAAEAERQLALLREPPAPARLLRPCTLGDGIVVLDDERRVGLEAAWAAAQEAGRARKFVPASGAATRMFRSLSGWLEPQEIPPRDELRRRADDGDAAAADLLRFAEHVDELPFAPLLEEALGEPPGELAARGELRRLLAVALTSDGLGLADRAKGTIPFHRYGERTRTPVSEHLVEGAAYVTDRDGVCRVHFTVPPDQRVDFEERVTLAKRRHESRFGVRFEVTYSSQSPTTDTLAVTPEGEPFRQDDGTLLLRPGGHGALLGNLAALEGDVVFLKNIDNVLPEREQGRVAAWQRALGGLLVDVQARVHEAVRHLRAGGDPAAARSVVAEDLGMPDVADALARSAASPEEYRGRLLGRLDRPLRVCGVVENRGEPGGGPFWVDRGDGRVARQIVEKAEVPDDDEQREVFAASTHFNPVQIVCGLRDADGRPYDLARFVDDRAVFIARKSHQGRPLLALERPGLWNGAMAGWNTLFVEVPESTFAPVKTVFDLLRPAHRV